jgi:hypothetical protein
MKKFIIHNQEGKILRTGSCPDEMLEIQAQDGEKVIEGIADDSKHYVNNGKVTEFTPEMKSAREKVKQEMQAKNDQDILIRNKINDILRTQAITELKKEGKIKDFT